MHRHLQLILVLLTATACFAGGADTIVPRSENGRTVYVNDDSSPIPAASSAIRRSSAPLVYWSNTEHRYKALPRPTPWTMRRARAAAAEVTQFLATQPQGTTPAATQQDPNYAGISRGRAVTNEQIDKAIDDAAARNGVDPNLVRAIIKVESNFNPKAVSRKGAMGLMQLMPSTARSLNVANPFDPQQNIDGGVRHFKSLMDTFNGDLELSLAAYNAGASAVQKFGGVPNYTETQDYVRRITDIYGSNATSSQSVGGTRTPGARPMKVTRDSRGQLVITNE